MSTFWLCFRKAALPALAAALVGGAAAHVAAAARGSAAPWLALPCFLVPLAAVLRTVSLWPAFATDADGRELVCRAAGGAARSLRGAVLGGAFAALFALFALAVAMQPLLPEPRAHLLAPPLGRPCLDANGRELVFPVGFAASELRLRPIVLPLGDDLVATRVRVLVDGIPAPGGEVAITGDRQLLRVPLADRVVERVTLQQTAGTLALWFDEGAAVAVASAPESRLANSGLLALALALPALVALAIAAAFAPFLRMTTTLVASGGLLVLQTLGRIGPADPALTACGRGHWLAGEAVFWPALASLATGCLAMIAAMATHAERRR